MSSTDEQDLPDRQSPARPQDPRHKGQQEPEKKGPREPAQPAPEEFPPREQPNPQDNPPTRDGR